MIPVSVLVSWKWPRRGERRSYKRLSTLMELPVKIMILLNYCLNSPISLAGVGNVLLQDNDGKSRGFKNDSTQIPVQSILTLLLCFTQTGPQ